LADSSLDRAKAGAVAAGIAAAALVVVAAAGIFGVVGRSGFFHTEDWQVVLTLVAAFLCGSCATAGLRLLERRLVDPLGWLAVVVGAVSFAVVAVGIWWLDGWREHGETLGKVVASALVVLISTLVVATLRLVRPPRSRFAFALFVLACLCAVGIDGLALAKIWSLAPTERDNSSAAGSAGARLMLAFGIVGVLAFLLTPLAERLELLVPRTRRAGESSRL
jgi:hypothetical protein